MSSAAACFQLRHRACVPGEDTMLSDQPYRYLTVDEMKSLGDDSLPIDVTRDERIDSNRECMGKYVTFSFVMDFRDEVFHFLSLCSVANLFLPLPFTLTSVLLNALYTFLQRSDRLQISFTL